jgi:hypothetical protein
MVQQSPIDEQIREYILQEERIGETRRQRVRIDEGVRQERRKWERRLGYFILAGVAVVVFALNEYFPDKPVRVVLIVLGGGVLAFLGALIYVNGFLWVMEKLGYRARPGRFPGPAGGAPLPNFVGAGRTGAGSGACDGSKQSDISSAVSSRVLMDWMPNNVWQNFKRLMCER